MPTRPNIADKNCLTCGRPFSWRKKWEKDWDSVRYCSRACRRALSSQDKKLEEIILSLLDQRKAGSSICPSEAARALHPNEWRMLMEQTRRAARRLSLEGKIDVTQKGRAVKSMNFKGPIRLRLTQVKR